jgi:hypothetical protein
MDNEQQRKMDLCMKKLSEFNKKVGDIKLFLLGVFLTYTMGNQVPEQAKIEIKKNVKEFLNIILELKYIDFKCLDSEICNTSKPDVLQMKEMFNSLKTLIQDYGDLIPRAVMWYSNLMNDYKEDCKDGLSKSEILELYKKINDIICQENNKKLEYQRNIFIIVIVVLVLGIAGLGFLLYKSK